MSETSSGWSYYIGVVAEDRLINSSIVKALCHEITPFSTGEISDRTITEVVTIIDEITELSEQISAKTTNTITATFWPDHPNMSVPPFVKKGERVWIKRYRDSDTYYWLPIGFDKNLHTPEYWRVFVSNNSNGGDMDDQNTYFFELDSLVNKHIKLQTSKSDGEKYKYTISIDAKRSKVYISDDGGRVFNIDSENDTISMQNAGKSFVAIHDKDCTIRVSEDINVQADKNISFSAGDNITMKSKEITLISEDSQSEITINGTSIIEKSNGSEREIKAGSIADKTSGTTMNMSSAGMTSTGANMVISGGTSVAMSAPGMSVKSSGGSGSTIEGNLSIEGHLLVTQNLSVVGTGTFGGSVNAPNID